MIKLTLVSVFLSCVASFFLFMCIVSFLFYCAAFFVLSSGRVSWFWCSILFERIKFSSIRTELSRANSFSTVLLSNLERGYKCSHSNLQSFSSLSWFSPWLMLLHTLKTTITIWVWYRMQLNPTDYGLFCTATAHRLFCKMCVSIETCKNIQTALYPTLLDRWAR